MRMFGFIIVCLVVGFLGYVRLAPDDVERWHQPITSEVDKTMKGGAIRIVPNSPGAFDRLESALRNMDRTELLAGSATDGRVTYITRTKWAGFRDYTTLEQSGEHIKMFARLRFGGSDLGVNAARLQKLIGALE